MKHGLNASHSVVSGREGGMEEEEELDPASQLNEFHILYLNSSDISTFELEEDYDGRDRDG